MLPVLVELGKFTIHTFGVLLAISVVVGIIIARRELTRKKLDPTLAYDLALFAMVGGILGARLTYVFSHVDEYLSRPLAIFAIWEGGLIFYGGLVGGAAALLLFLRFKRLPLGKTADVMAPALAMGSAIGRVGCFANGCCYGLPTRLPWGVAFTDPRAAIASSDPDLLGHLLQPTQLYEVGYNLITFSILWALRKRLNADGLLFWVFAGFYGFFRFLVEFVRIRPILIANLGGSQLFSLVLVAASLIVIVAKYAGGKSAINDQAEA